jgi:hypothetical protein
VLPHADGAALVEPWCSTLALLARETDDGLVYAGAAMVTLPHPERDMFWRRTEGMKIAKPVLPAELSRTKASYVTGVVGL